MKKINLFYALMFTVSFSSQAAIFGQINDLTYMLNSGILVKAVAKEYCTCKYMYDMSLNECLERNHLPVKIASLIRVDVNDKEKTIRVRPTKKTFMLLGGKTEASSRYVKYGKMYGCQVYQEKKINFDDEK